MTIINKSKRFLLILRFQEYYDDFSEAKRDVQNGKLCGIMYFSQNFSEGMQKRLEETTFVEDSHLNASQIQVFLDMGGTLFIYAEHLSHNEFVEKLRKNLQI
jgi:hypothetical protein